MFISKFPIIEQFDAYFNILLGDYETEDLPAFEFEWYGAKLSLMDFTLLKDYLTPIKSLIGVFITLEFVFGLFYKLPALIDGSTNFTMKEVAVDDFRIKQMKRRGIK